MCSFYIETVGGENLRGEERWERNVHECLTQAGMPLSRHEPKLSLSHVRPGRLTYQPGAKLYLFHTWFGLLEHHYQQIGQLMGQGATVYITQSYDLDPRLQATVAERLGDIMHVLNPPVVKQIYYDNDVFGDTLVWHSRDIQQTLDT